MTTLRKYPILTRLNYTYQEGRATHDVVRQIKDSLTMTKTNNLKDFIVLNLNLKAAFDSPTSSYLQET